MEFVKIPKHVYNNLVECMQYMHREIVAPSQTEWISEAEAMRITGLSKSGLAKKRKDHPEIFRQRLGNKVDKLNRTIVRGIQYDKAALNGLFSSPLQS